MTNIPTLVFPDTVALTVDTLNAELPALGINVPVANRVPSPRPAAFVTVERVGGTRRTVVTEGAHMYVQAWANSTQEAGDIAQACRSVLFGMAHRTVAGIPVYLVEDVGGPAEVPDPLSDQPRKTFTVAIHVRGRTT